MTTSSDPRTPAPAHRYEADHLHLSLLGDLDRDTSHEVLSTAAAVLANRGRTQNLSIDCHRLDFVDSLGLAALLEIHRDAALLGVAVRLTRTRARLERLLHLTGTYTHLTGRAPADGAI
ncbi:STAS domain-containing protein [Streptomyces rubiginosohelvolus]|uniref:STAS domain-containing protein n=1 Tax=Streptomyces rubiginosohelvolus TaxID=67362 RepID=UPI0033C2FD81